MRIRRSRQLHQDRPDGRAAAARPIPIGSAIASFFAAVACSYALPGSILPRSGTDSGYQPSSFARRSTLEEPRSASPKRPGCHLKDGILSYSDGEASRSIRLDADVSGARRTICSDLYTVILTNDSAVVSLGGEPILQGREMLGLMGGRFVPANSYSVDITMPSSEGLQEASVVKTRLILRTGKSRWSLDLSDPSAWNIY